MLRLKLRPLTFIGLVLSPFAFCLLGLLIAAIGLLGEGYPTFLVGCGVVLFGITGMLQWLPGCRRVLLDERGISVRNWWRDERVGWEDIDEILVTSGFYLRYYSKPGGVALILRTRGYFGVRRSIDIPDIFNVKKAELAALIEKSRLRHQGQ